MYFIDGREELITAINNLSIVSQGNKPTSESQNYSLTIETENIKPQITKWQVLDIESLSDHNYITFDIEKQNSNWQKHEIWDGTPKNWINWNINPPKLKRPYEGEQVAKYFSNTIHNICHEVITQIGTKQSRTPVYKCIQEIAKPRKHCLKMFRDYRRSARRNIPARGHALWQSLKECKAILEMHFEKMWTGTHGVRG